MQAVNQKIEFLVALEQTGKSTGDELIDWICNNCYQEKDGNEGNGGNEEKEALFVQLARAGITSQIQLQKLEEEDLKSLDLSISQRWTLSEALNRVRVTNM